MRVPFARFKAPYAAPSSALAPTCANCATPLDVGQDWCLECGSAVPGRFGPGPGLRSSLGVVGVTLLLVIGAVAAAYAALSSDSKQATRTTASVPAQAPLTPDVAPTTATPGTVVPGTAPPGTAAVLPVPNGTATAVPTAPKIPAATPTPTASPTAPVTPPAKSTPTAPVTKPKATTTPKAATPTPSAPAAKSAKILLDTDAASTYNPYSLAPTGFGSPARAIDGDPTTAWTYQLDTSTGGKTLVGLAINLKSAQRVRTITLATPTPGMTVEFYGATGSQPVSITDPAWLHLANRRNVKAQATVSLKTTGKAFDYLLVWITHAPPGVTAGTIGVSELSVST
jgi:hypothetical protein